MTEIIRIDPIDFDPEELASAAEMIKNGKTVVFPTETVYGLGSDATHTESAKKIYAAKGRPSDNPLIIHISEPAEAEAYCHTSEMYYRLAERFMPGPLTVIMPKKDTIPKAVTGGLDTVAVRCPLHRVAHELIRMAGVPIAAPSANLSGSPSPTCVEHVIADMNGRVDCIIDGGEAFFGVESTIVLINPDQSLTMLRPGAVTYEDLLSVTPKVIIAKAVMHSIKENEQPLSPGMKYKHYAPKKPLILLDGGPENRLSFMIKAQKEERAILICYDEQKACLRDEGIISIGGALDTLTQAHRIFSALRESDKLAGDIIYGNLPPTEGIGLALYNRLIRAAAHTVINTDNL